MNMHGHVMLVITGLLLWMLATGPPVWSQSVQVLPGQSTVLSVVPVQGNIYSWELYTNTGDVNLAQTLGNCPASAAYFTGSSTGSNVEVMWVLPGTYYYKVTAEGNCTANNIKVGKVEVTNGIVVNGEIDLIAQRIVECSMQTLSLPVMVSGFDSVASFRLQLSYDPSKMEFEGISEPETGILDDNLYVLESSPGIISINYQDPDILSIEDGNQLFMLQFYGKQKGMTNLEWNFLECVVYKDNTNTIPIRALVHGVAEILESPGVVALKDSVLCSGDSITLNAVSTYTGPLNYVWSHGTQHHVGDSWHLSDLEPENEGYYIVKAMNMYCSSADTIEIIVHPDPNLQIAYADTIFFSSPFTLGTNNDYAKYQWSDGSTLASITVYEPGMYKLNVVDFTGCRDADSIVMLQESMAINIPNAFTPNGDGLNDTFKPEFIGFEPLRYRMEIYSRWGQLVFSTTDLSQAWNGLIDGKEAGPEVFVYVISYNVPSYVIVKDKNNPIRGTVTIIK